MIVEYGWVSTSATANNPATKIIRTLGPRSIVKNERSRNPTSGTAKLRGASCAAQKMK